MVIQTNLHGGKGFVWGDGFAIRRDVIVPSGLTVTKAYLTVKTNQTDNDGSALFQKSITTTNTAGTGQIEDAGSSGTAVLRFDITSTNSQAPAKDTLVYFSLRVIYSDGTDITLENGQTSFMSSTTGAVS